MPMKKKQRQKHQPKKESVVAPFLKPPSMANVDMQVMQSVVNNYKSLLQQIIDQQQSFQQQVQIDMNRLMEEVPGLKDRLRISDDGYEVMELEPEEA